MERILAKALAVHFGQPRCFVFSLASCAKFAGTQDSLRKDAKVREDAKILARRHCCMRRACASFPEPR